jgi:uncharacterized delta-60 repeat protein
MSFALNQIKLYVMKKMFILSLIAFCLVFTTKNVLGQNPGDLDSNFAIDGYNLTDPIAITGESYQEMATRPNDKIVIGGYADIGTNRDILLMQFLPDGTIDSSFGANGITQVDATLGGDEQILAIEILNDGKILAAGAIQTMAGYDAFIMRFNEDGSPDASFGTSGGAMTLFNTGTNTAATGTDIEVLPDNSILVGATVLTAPNFYDMAVFKFSVGGGLSVGFGVGGSAVVDVAGDEEALNSIDVMSNGKILMAGYGFVGGVKEAAVIMLTSAGVLDISFNSTGIYLFNNLTSENIFYSVLADNHGKILAAGSSGVNADGVILRLNANGVIDSSFSNNGIQVSDIGGSDGIYLYGLSLQTNDRILVTGNAFGTTVKAAYALMLENDGSPVSDFGTGGDVYHELPSTTNSIAGTCMTQQSDGSLLIGGHFSGPDFPVSNLFMIRLYNHSYVGIESQEVQPILVYPNPTSEFFAVQLPENEMIRQVGLYDLNGKLVQSWGTGINVYNLPVYISGGSYILRIQTNDYIYSSSIIINK